MCEKKLVDCYEFHKIVLQSQQKILAGMLCMVDQHHHQVIEPISSELNSSLSSDEIFNGTFDLLEDALAIANDPLNEVKEVEGDFSFIVPIVDTTTGVVPLNDDDVQRCVTNFNIDERLEYFDNSKVKVEEKIDENANQASKKENARNKFEEDSQKIKSFYDFSCPECKNTKRFENFTALKSHMKSVHKIEQPGIYCCKKKLRARHDLLAHLTFHVDPDQFKYVFCSVLTLNFYLNNFFSIDANDVSSNVKTKKNSKGIFHKITHLFQKGNFIVINAPKNSLQNSTYKNISWFI